MLFNKLFQYGYLVDQPLYLDEASLRRSVHLQTANQHYRLLYSIT